MIKFIKQERIYIWMAFFVIMVNLLSMGYPHKAGNAGVDKKSISERTFKDMGITEEKIKLFFESGKPSAAFFKYGIIIGFLIFIACMAMNLIYIFRKKSLIPDKAPERKPVSWNIEDIFRLGVIVLFSAYVFNVSGSIILKQFHFNMDLNLRMILGTVLVDIAAGITILYFILIKYKEKISSLGITLSDFYKNILSGITAYVFILPILLATLIMSALFLEKIGYKMPPQPVFDMFIEEKRSGVILFLTIFVSVLGPVIEEMFFRGFLYSAVKKSFGVIISVLLSGALFSLLHVNIAGFIPIMILGVLMALLYEATGSLVAPITIHILHNSIIVGFVFFIKELLK